MTDNEMLHLISATENEYWMEEAARQERENVEYLDFLADLENDYHRLTDEEIEEGESWEGPSW